MSSVSESDNGLVAQQLVLRLSTKGKHRSAITVLATAFGLEKLGAKPTLLMFFIVFSS